MPRRDMSPVRPAREESVTTQEPPSGRTPVPESDPAAEPVVSLPTGNLESSAMVRVLHGDDATAGLQPLPDGSPLIACVPRGGRLSAQLQVRVPRAGELGAEIVGADGATADGAAEPSWTVRVIQEIPRVEPGATSATPGDGVTVDPLPTAPHPVQGGRRVGLWLTIEVAAKVPAGRHHQQLRVLLDGETLAAFAVTVTVPEVTLASPSERRFNLDLWWHPDAIADHLGVEPWGSEHWAAMRPYLTDLAEHGQRVVNAVVIEDPWLVDHTGSERPQTASGFASLVEWRWDGTEFTFDFDRFDRMVLAHQEAGITGPIHLFAMIQFRLGERLTYLDTRSDELVTERVELGDRRYRQGWRAFLAAAHQHLVKRGWWERAALAFDERPKELMDRVYAVVHEEAPQWDGKNALAAVSLADADSATYISFNHLFLADVPAELIKRRRSAGQPTLFYTYHEPARPNTITAAPPISARALGWEVARYELDGYLRWSYKSWPFDVFTNPCFQYGQGDEYIVYPGPDGPVSSMRWESLRDGQDDAELLRMLRAAGHPEVLQRCLDLVDPQAADTPDAWRAMVTARAEAIAALVE